LTRNQGCDELQTAVTLRLEELNCLHSPEEEDEDDGSESGSEDSDEEGIIVEFTMEDNILEDVLEHEVSIAYCVSNFRSFEFARRIPSRLKAYSLI